ncbi:hypothetical protein AGMMS50230_09220 [Spirochaetia bacterium]|nr:hypothetical protein AGMMS50230_09220 [Spirochaetia bacterium]
MDTDLLRRLPPVLRARGWRLYTTNGRLVDLWQSGGRALLGHNPPGLLRSIKNSGERGLFAPFPHSAEERLYKALGLLFPRRRFRLYKDEASLDKMLTLSAADGKAAIDKRWRPYLDKGALALFDTTPVFIPILPFSFPGAPAVLVLDPAADAEFPPSQVLSPLVLTAAARSIYDLLAVPKRGNPYFPKVDKALHISCRWKRRGIYLSVVLGGGETYASVFQHFLEGGFLLPPGPEENAILPGELSPGEQAKLAALFGW